MNALAHLRTLVLLAGFFELVTALFSLLFTRKLCEMLGLDPATFLFQMRMTGAYQFIIGAAILLGGIGYSDLQSVSRVATYFHGCFLAFALLAVGLALFPAWLLAATKSHGLLESFIQLPDGMFTYLCFCVIYHAVMLALTWFCMKKVGFSLWGPLPPPSNVS